MMHVKLSLVLFMVGLSVIVRGTEHEPCLADMQKKYTGQRVIVRSLFLKNNKQFDWYEAKKEGDYYVANRLKYLPVSYIGQEAEITAIQLNKKERDELSEKTNAFGEKVDAGTIINPFVEIVVRFDDGKVGLTNANPGTLDFKIEMVSIRETRKKELAGFISSVVNGDTLYATGSSIIFKSSAGIEDMLLDNHIMESRDFPRLEPLIIEASKFLPEQNIIILKLKDPKNHYYLSYANAEKQIYLDDYHNLLETIASEMKMLTIFPDFLTADEINAIKIGACFKGMSVTALHYSIGLPDEQKQDAGNGNLLIYGDWLNIRLDHQNEHIISYQIMDDGN